MLRCPNLPLLPGTQFRDVTKTDYHLSHQLNRYHGFSMLSAVKRPGIGGSPLPDPNGPPNHLPSLYPPYTGTRMSPWIVYDRKVLCFNAYFKETVTEIFQTPYRVRSVRILFYLEDGTIQVSEPRIINSGFPQGCIVSRQRVPRAPPCNNEFLSILDLNVSDTVRIFDRVYVITGCDNFTKDFLTRAGITVSEPLQIPKDPRLEILEPLEVAKQPKKPSKSVDGLGQFLQMDRKVLRFYGYWDDREAMFGDLRKMELYYYLADDTIQIVEKYEENCGRDGPATFLSRQRIPKLWTGPPVMGQNTKYTVLNVLGRRFSTERYVADILNVGQTKIEYYKDSDLIIGKTVNIYGRLLLLTDCDKFTKEYYEKKYGIESIDPVPTPKLDLQPPPVPFHLRKMPLFNGWGSHEDSEGNCRTVLPQPPKIDVVKFLKLDGCLLRFGAKMILSKYNEDSQRMFIISYYMSDDTISVFETAGRNSGFIRQMFFSRSRFYLPNQEWFSSNRPEYYTSKHFYVGATLNLRNYKFHLITADSFCLMYMEFHPDEFPKANINRIMDKIRTAIRPNYKEFVTINQSKLCGSDECPIIRYDVLWKELIDLLGDEIVEHEMITLARAFAADRRGDECHREVIRSIVHLALTQNIWDHMDSLRHYIEHLNPTKLEYLPASRIWSFISGARIPLKGDLVEAMLKVLNRNKDGDLSVCDFMEFIDRTKYKSAPIQPLNIFADLCSEYMTAGKHGQIIKWEKFLKKLDLDREFQQDSK